VHYLCVVAFLYVFHICAFVHCICTLSLLIIFAYYLCLLSLLIVFLHFAFANFAFTHFAFTHFAFALLHLLFCICSFAFAISYLRIAFAHYLCSLSLLIIFVNCFFVFRILHCALSLYIIFARKTRENTVYLFLFKILANRVENSSQYLISTS